MVTLWPQQAPAVAMFVGLGLGFGVLEVVLLTLTQRVVPVDVLARVYGAQETVTILAMAAGALAASGLVAGLGVQGALTVTGLVLPVVALGLVGRLGVLDGGASATDADFELLRGVEPFATLPVATIESLAVRATHASVLTGDHVVRQGEPGHHFFVIKSGEVEVIESGEVRGPLGAGEYFGEIALLRGSVRTASVRARSTVGLLVLSRAEFLAAVEHPRTRHGLNRVANERLHHD